MAIVQTREQTDWLQECDMPHSLSERLCLFDSEFSMSAKEMEKSGCGGLSNKKKLTCRYSSRRQLSLEFRLNTYLVY